MFPSHDRNHVKEILKRYNDNFLPKLDCTLHEFNLVLREMCESIGLTQEIYGKLKNKTTGNKTKFGYFPKYMLISSHTMRRSMATNLYGKVPNEVIRILGGWKTIDMMLHYIQKLGHDTAKEVTKYWETQGQQIEKELNAA